MASVLRAAGEEIEMLVLLIPTPGVGTEAPETEDELVLEFGKNWLEQMAGGASAVDELLTGLGAPVSLPRLIDLGREAGLVPTELERSRIEARFDIFRRLRRAASGYRPRPGSGPMSVLSAERRLARHDEPSVGWERLVGPIEAAWLPATHFSILREPVVERVARHVLDRLRGEAP